MATRELTDLEAVALGIVWKQPGRTAYEVMSEFSQSLTARFRSGAGSVYPLMNRLLDEGFLLRRDTRRGNQEKAVYRISASGKKCLTAWLSPPLSPDNFRMSPDPVRTRIYFLGLLDAEQRMQFLGDVHAGLKQELAAAKTLLEEYQAKGNRFGVLAMKGAVRVMRARILWIAEIRRELESEI